MYGNCRFIITFSCCVDEVAAEHGLASALVHFGPSCLSPPSVLPVLFVFGKDDVDVDDLINQVDLLGYHMCASILQVMTT